MSNIHDQLKIIKEQLKEINETYNKWQAFHVEDQPRGVYVYEQKPKTGEIRVRHITSDDVEIDRSSNVINSPTLVDKE